MNLSSFESKKRNLLPRQAPKNPEYSKAPKRCPRFGKDSMMGKHPKTPEYPKAPKRIPEAQD